MNGKAGAIRTIVLLALVAVTKAIGIDEEAVEKLDCKTVVFNAECTVGMVNVGSTNAIKCKL